MYVAVGAPHTKDGGGRAAVQSTADGAAGGSQLHRALHWTISVQQHRDEGVQPPSEQRAEGQGRTLGSCKRSPQLGLLHP